MLFFYWMLICMPPCLSFKIKSKSLNPKKGMAVCSGGYQCGDTYALPDTSWWYDWRWNQPEHTLRNCTGPTRGNYVPMIPFNSSAHEAILTHDAKYVLGFNEPNGKKHADLTPQQTAELWPLVEDKAGDRILVSPALWGCDTQVDMCIKWYDQFFSACKGCRVERMAVHGYHCVPYQMIQSLGKLCSHFNRQIWLNEFSCNNNATVEQDMNFMKVMVPLLNEASFVERYAWFCNRVHPPIHLCKFRSFGT